MKNLFVHRADHNNAGDWHSCPNAYLEVDYQGIVLDYPQLRGLSGWDFDNIIIGGGGLPDRFLNLILDFLPQQQYKNLVLWGTGWEINNPKMEQLADLSNLTGIREWLPDTRYACQWVPCASVLHPAVLKYQKYQSTKDFLIIDHPKRNCIAFDLPHSKITNTLNSIENILWAIAEHRFILTSSYHGAYWATLLGRRVMFISDPFLPKCNTMRYPIPCAEKFSWEALDQSVKYPNAYEECRNQTLSFIEQFKQLNA